MRTRLTSSVESGREGRVRGGKWEGEDRASRGGGREGDGERGERGEESEGGGGRGEGRERRGREKKEWRVM